MQPLLPRQSTDDYEILLHDESKVTTMKKSRSKLFYKGSLIGVAFAFTYILFHFSSRNKGWQNIVARHVELPHVYTGRQTTNPVNSTLGFQQILALNLPHRLDKKDELTLMGLASDIKVDFHTTRLVEDLKESGLPHHVDLPFPGVIGCWRAHVDAWQRIVSERITSALILEDDTDWDVDIKKQLQLAHQPLSTLLKSISTDDKDRVSTMADPWMHDDWDVLFLGYCLEHPFEENYHPSDVDPSNPPHVLYDDGTMLDRSAMDQKPVDSIVNYMDYYGYTLLDSKNITSIPPKRMVARSHSPVCMSAYAVSLKGAARLLYHTSREIDQPVDIQMMSLIAKGKITSYEIMPPLMAQWKIKDGGSKNSDNDISANHDKYVENKAENINHNPSIGFSENIRNSVRKSLPQILAKM